MDEKGHSILSTLLYYETNINCVFFVEQKSAIFILQNKYKLCVFSRPKRVSTFLHKIEKMSKNITGDVNENILGKV